MQILIQMPSIASSERLTLWGEAFGARGPVVSRSRRAVGPCVGLNSG